jgi:glutathione-specific gamma-glutamylcyclotransferase
MSLRDTPSFNSNIASSNEISICTSQNDFIEADWIFAYGSLIWNPEVDFETAELGKVFGKHRNFCIQSTMYRGTPECPGVVLGLDKGGSCVGMAFKLRSSTRKKSLELLYRREMPNKIYKPTLVNVHLQTTGLRIQALTFAANREHSSYMCLTDDQLIDRLNVCVGDRGPNKDYALNTWQALKDKGVRDARLEKIATRLLRLNSCV